MSISGNWEKRRVETFGRLGSSGEPVRVASEEARISAAIELDPERIKAQERADRKS